MSVITQFFPSGGGGGGGNETSTGIKIPADGIPVEILGVSGGGGGPVSSDGASGGAGAVFHTTKYAVQPGCTVPITIGVGGAAGGCPENQGSQGGTTSFNYPILPISVVGGGGGGDASGPTAYGGCPGGNGGGGSGCNTGITWPVSSNGGCGCYYQSVNSKEVEVYACSKYPSPNFRDSNVITMSECSACAMQYPWGIKAGYPGTPGGKSANPSGIWRYAYGQGGQSGGNGFSFCCLCQANQGEAESLWYKCKTVNSTTYKTSIAGDLTEINGPGQFGAPGPVGGTGSNGGLIIQWSTVFGAATASPGATDISPVTPGYYTYCFTSSGSIGLP